MSSCFVLLIQNAFVLTMWLLINNDVFGDREELWLLAMGSHVSSSEVIGILRSLDAFVS